MMTSQGQGAKTQSQSQHPLAVHRNVHRALLQTPHPGLRPSSTMQSRRLRLKTDKPLPVQCAHQAAPSFVVGVHKQRVTGNI